MPADFDTVTKRIPAKDPVFTRIVFWNVNNRDLTSIVCSLATTTLADVLVLNEDEAPSRETLQALRKTVSSDFYIPIPASKERFHCFCRNSALDMSQIHSGSRISVRKLNIGVHHILLALVHGPDMRNYDSEARLSFAHRLATEIQFVKGEQKNNKLILIGDFNMNPYERGMNLAAGLNAMMTKTCVRSGTRRYLGEDYEFYYNPMWSLFGDIPDGPAGTVYDTSSQGPYGWSMLDQVLFNHSIVDLFADVKILTTSGSHSLMDANGRPDSRNASDHFPIMLTLREEIDND